MENVILMLGGNLGNVRSSFDFAVQELCRNGFVLQARSGAERSAAVDCVPDTPDFLDEAVMGFWGGSPEELLKVTQNIEELAGRPRQHSSRESRKLDIDIILFGSRVLDTPELIIPHPRAAQRHFVLNCLRKIAPDAVFPDCGKSVMELFGML